MPPATENKTQGFSFNLLPPKPKEEVELEVEREDSITYAVVLIFVAALLYFVLVLVTAFITEPRLRSAKTAIDNRNQQVANFTIVQSLHGELYVKTQTLKPVLDLDLDPAEIFRVSDALIGGDTSSRIIDYSRERSGVFVFQIISPSFTDVTTLARRASQIEGVSDVFIRGAVADATNTSVTTTLALSIDALQPDTTTN